MAQLGNRRERLSAADVSNLAFDTPDQANVIVIAGVLSPGGPVGADGAVDFDAIRTAIAEAVPTAPRLNQRVAANGRGFVWETVPVELDRHVRMTDPADGSAGLEALCARLMTTPLPRDRPLWELLIVPGVAPARAGMVLRIHHAMADGTAAARLVEQLLRPLDAVASADVVGPGAPRTRQQLGLRERTRSIASGWERTFAMFRQRVPRTVLLGPISSRRAVAFTETPLAPIAVGAATVDATVNDALLAAVASATEAALRERGEPVPPTLPVSVPVALAERGSSGNATGVMLVPLPPGDPDTARRLRRIAELTRPRKADARERGTHELTRSRLGARLIMFLGRHQRLIIGFVSNVRGPSEPLDLAGAPIEHAWALAGMGGNVRLGVAALTYGGRLSCAVQCHPDAISAPVFAAALSEEFARIAALE